MIASLVLDFLLGVLVVLVLLAAVAAAIDFAKTVLAWRAAVVEKELAGDWWPRFERDFQQYAARRAAARER